MKPITADEARILVDQLGPSLGCGDNTYSPMFPKGNKDICLVHRLAANGHSYGYDTLYLVWKDQKSEIKCIKKSFSSENVIVLKEISVKNGTLIVRAMMRGLGWKEVMKTKLDFFNFL